MGPMGWRRRVLKLCLGVVLWADPSSAQDEEDWRIEMLRVHGFSGKTAELEKLAARATRNEKGLDQQLERLGSEHFQVREQAQASILMAGGAALSWMATLPAQEDPEVRARLAEIRVQLQVRGTGSKEELLRYAVKSLLAERKGGKKTERLVFAEWFQLRQNPLRESYGKMEFHKDEGLTGKVRDGSLRFHGQHKGDGDQCLLLTASKAWGKKVLPEKFRVSCRLGGSSGEGSGAWHLGLSVGQVRVLFHPGMKGGGFRVETIEKKSVVRPISSMGFDPSTKGFQRMAIDVRKLKSGDVQLDVTVLNTNGEGTFTTQVVVDGAVISPLDQVGLWRSGRRGADALFDDFVLDLRGNDQ